MSERRKRKKLIFAVLIFVVITAVQLCFNVKVNAAGIDRLSYENIQSGPALYTSTTSSGVSELDAASTKVNQLIIWICGWVGGAIAIISFVYGVIMAANHQPEQRNQAIFVAFIGIVICFAPQIINYILGR